MSFVETVSLLLVVGGTKEGDGTVRRGPPTRAPDLIFEPTDD